MRKPTAPQEEIQPLYPDLSAEILSTNEDAQNFRLKQIRDIRDQLEKEAETRGRLRRRYKALYNTAYYVSFSSGLVSTATSTASVICLSTVIGALPALPLGIVAITTGVVGLVSSKISKLVLKKTEKHERIKLIALSKLSSVNSLVSKALSDSKISDEEFHVILNEMEGYREHKSQIRTGVRNELSSERAEEIRIEAEKKGLLKGQEIAMSNLHSIMKGTGQT